MPRSIDPLAIALILAVIGLVMLGALSYRLLVDRGRLLLRLEEGKTADARAARQTRGLPSGAYLSDFALPRFAGSGNDSRMVTLSELTGQALLIVFLRAGCLFSRAFARELARQERAVGAPLPVSIVIGEADPEANSFSDLPGPVLLDADGHVARLMRIRATPSGYLVDDARRTVGQMLAGPEALLAVARGEVGIEDHAAPLALSPLPSRASPRLTRLSTGAPAPDFTLPAVGGGAWTLSAQRGTPLLLLFSDPDCPPCAALLAELGQLASSGLVIVSRGEIAENQPLAVGIKAPFLLQKHREIARAYRTLETPAAFVIGAAGEIAEGPAIGKDAVLDLILHMPSGKILHTSAETRPA